MKEVRGPNFRRRKRAERRRGESLTLSFREDLGLRKRVTLGLGRGGKA